MALADVAGWIALVATCVAAVMTASNLGARVTGWGFVIFTIGAAAWIVVGLATGHAQLLWSNVFLALVDVFGVWRWLGRRARISDTAQAEERRSEHHAGQRLFPVTTIDGLPVTSAQGQVIAHAVEALVSCRDGRIDYLIVRTGGVGGVGETLRRLPWPQTRMTDGAIRTHLDADAIARLPVAAAA